MHRLKIKAAKLFCRDEMRSLVLRNLFKKHYGIEIGLYSYGCFDKKRIPKNSRIGRFCSFAQTAYIFNADHPKKYLSLHPFFYNPSSGFISEEKVTRTQIVIEDDVWLGHNSVLLSGVSHVGRGAIVAAGAIVVNNVPAYSIVAGIPARVIGYRFPSEIIKKIENSKWWEMDEATLRREYSISETKFTNPSEFFANEK